MITREQFHLQIQRLEDTFGDRHFPDQRTHMIWNMICELEYPSVIRIVDDFIMSSKFAPLPADFLEAVRAIQKANFQRDVKAASDISNWQNGLGEYLTKEYPGAKSLKEAAEIQVLRNQVARAKNEIV